MTETQEPRPAVPAPGADYTYVHRGTDSANPLGARGYGPRIAKLSPGSWVCTLIDTDKPMAMAWHSRVMKCGHMRYVKPGRNFPSGRPCAVCVEEEARDV